MHHCKLTVLLSGIVPLVASHGGGMHYTINDVVYPGTYPLVLNTTAGSIQRVWNWDGIMSERDTHLSCGTPGTPYAINSHAPLTAGSTISVNYTIPGNNWTFGHPIGPMFAYMARCPDSGCESVDLVAPIWFKIFEAGLISGTLPEGYWKMKDVNEGANLDIPTPKSLKSGKYLLRHEMVNLQTGPVQFFPNCIQLEVSGTGSSLPEQKDLVAFPGAYDKDVGKSWPVSEGATWLYWTHKDDTVYPMPGPPLWQG